MDGKEAPVVPCPACDGAGKIELLFPAPWEGKFEDCERCAATGIVEVSMSDLYRHRLLDPIANAILWAHVGALLALIIIIIIIYGVTE